MSFYSRVTSLILFSVTVWIFVEVDCLDVKGEGVCVARLSFRESRSRSNNVVVIKWCGKKKCKERKSVTQYYTVWKTHAVCCNGWQHNGQLDICEPICSTGCNNGKCIAPDKCRCDPPLHLHPDRINTCVPYECEPPCSNADCWDNVCKCHNGYGKYNSTHCVQCGEGFIVAPDSTCKPKCERECLNGTCSAPNTCTCATGYKRKDDYACQPICDCINGSCIAPGICSCFDGYTALNSTHCTPKCDSCENGVCVAPNDCRCDIGFAKTNGSCTPVCSDTCVNGFCSSPDVCSCIEGYQKSDNKKNLCFKPCVGCKGVCNLHGVCNDGRCIGKFKEIRSRTRRIYNWRRCRAKSCIITETYQVTVNKTSCCPGWQWLAANDTCTPLCKLGCENGTCVAPEVCHCDPPLILNRNTCLLPVCEPPCSSNSRCTANSTCRCDDGFFSINATHCAPICLNGFFNDPIECKPKCDRSCVNATCTAPNICTCIEGHRMIDKNTCVPDCTPSCENADCVAPNTCECFDGFKRDNDSKCIPKCDRCENGYCIAPNTCECFDGFKRDNDSKCIPKCDRCENGYCVAPNTCECFDGFKRDNDSKCIPKCDRCENGYCVAPNTCECFDGFKRDNDSKCIPKCDRCENGDCVAPDTCRCHKGYEGKNGNCTPVCEEPCNNGLCSEPNTCTCNLGYTLDPSNKFNCLPICEPKCLNASCVSPNTCYCLTGYYMTGNNWTCSPICDDCENGECVAPNNCRCNIGYTRESNKCRPICEKPCKNGVCSEPNVCSCDVGYEVDKTDKFNCKPICNDSCVNSTCIAPGVCQCLPGYESTERDHICKPKCVSCINGLCVAPDDCKCNRGYHMSNSICLPTCSALCVNGYCSSPETCSCEPGFKRNLDEPHICYKDCIGLCNNGECTLQGECLCDRGFDLLNDTCVEKEPVDCDTCKNNCTDSDCWCLDGTPCLLKLAAPDEVATTTSLAGLELTWILGGAVGLLLLILLMALILQMSRRGQAQENKTSDNGAVFGSVVYTVPDTLMTSRPLYDTDVTQEDTFYDEPSRYREDEEDGTNESLINRPH